MTHRLRLYELLFLLNLVAFVVLMVLWWGVLPALGVVWLIQRFA